MAEVNLSIIVAGTLMCCFVLVLFYVRLKALHFKSLDALMLERDLAATTVFS